MTKDDLKVGTKLSLKENTKFFKAYEFLGTEFKKGSIFTIYSDEPIRREIFYTTWFFFTKSEYVKMADYKLEINSMLFEAKFEDIEKNFEIVK